MQVSRAFFFSFLSRKTSWRTFRGFGPIEADYKTNKQTHYGDYDIHDNLFKHLPFSFLWKSTTATYKGATKQALQIKLPGSSPVAKA